MLGAASRRDAGLASDFGEGVGVKGLVEARRNSETLKPVSDDEGMPAKRRASERKCWTRSSHVAAECPSRPSAVERRQDENLHGNAIPEAERFETVRPEPEEVDLESEKLADMLKTGNGRD